jgi:hypothetical protein
MTSLLRALTIIGGALRARRGTARLLPAAASLLLGAAPAAASVAYSVSFDDPGGQYSSYYGRLRSDIQAAGADWTRYLAGSGTINLTVRFTDIPTMASYSATSAYVRSDGGIAVYEQGALAKLQAGGSGGGSDAIINIGRLYLTNELWFDPNPSARTAPVPGNRTDAESAFIHEFGHIFAFSGWRDPTTGALPGGYESSFDALVAQRAGRLYFTGAHAEALYGGPVPLTSGNYEHVGNGDGGPGGDLLSDLMNGVIFYRGTRYDISTLDLAILDDTGAALAPAGTAALATPPAALPRAADIPEPGAAPLLASSLAVLWAARRRFA